MNKLPKMTQKLLERFTDVFGDSDEICDSQPLSLTSVESFERNQSSNTAVEAAATKTACNLGHNSNVRRPAKGTGQYGEFRSVDEIDTKYRGVFSYPFFNLVQSKVMDDALYSDKSMVVCAPTGSGKTVVFEMAIVQLLMELENNEDNDFKIIYMAPVKALCTERLTEWYSKFTKLGLLCIEVTGDTDVDFSHLKPYRIIITTPEKWDMLTRRWRDHRQLVEVIKLFLIDEVHILNDETRGPVLEAVVSRMKTIETSVQSTHRIEQLQHQYQGTETRPGVAPNIRFIAVSATVGNPEDVAAWLGTADKPAVYYKFGDECRPVKLKRIVEGYHCAEGTSIFKFDLVLNYKLWPIIQKYHDGKPTLIFCNTRKSVALTAETLSREITISFNEEQKARLMALASTIKNKKLQTLVLSGVGCHHAGLLYEERTNIEQAFRNRDLPILITTTTLAMGVNLPAHLVIIKNTQQYVCGAYQEYSISTVLQMVGRAGRPQFDTEATAVIMTRLSDKPRYQALVGGSEPLQSYLHKRLPENLNSEAALGTVGDVAQCVQWLRSTFLSVRAAKDPKRYLGLPQTAPPHQISKKVEELCVKAMNGLASSGLITMDEACCIESTEAGRLMSVYYLDLETMKHIMKIDGSETLERLLWIVCESHELADMHLRMDERRCLNTLNRNNAAATIRFPMKGKITTRPMKLNCVIQAILGCLPIPDPSLNQEATKIMRIADRVCKCLVAYVTRPAQMFQQPNFYSAVLNTIILAKCIAANLWENSPFVSKQLKGIGPTFSTLLATAGKVNFMLLEESHPRDLERIMNKGPPIGNIIRKQISLLPKYQLTMTPVDEKVVSIQLVLLNHHNLSENMEQLTAEASHKSYIIIGDSENTLLWLTSFKDKDMIDVYDGTITYQITRKHSFEHNIYAHCVSSTIAGIDAHSEYVFKDVDPQKYILQSNSNEELLKKATKKQTTITDTFRERKRKNTDNEITQSKEKKKRESALFEKFKNLKESFGKTSQLLKNDLEKSTVMSTKILQDLTHMEKSNVHSVKHNVCISEQNTERNQQPVKSSFFEEPSTYEINDDDFINDEFMDDDKINNILNEIESEISKGNSNSNENSSIIHNEIVSKKINAPCKNTYSNIEKYKTKGNTAIRVNKNISKKSNYNFIDLLEKNIDLSDEEETKVEENSFSDTIKTQIEKYLQKTKTNDEPPNRLLKNLMEDEPVSSKEMEPIIIIQDKTHSTHTNKTKQVDQTEKSKREKNTNIDLHEEPTINKTLKQVSVLEHKIKSIDLGNINDEDELPAIEIGNIRKNDDANILNLLELKNQINKSSNEPDYKQLHQAVGYDVCESDSLTGPSKEYHDKKDLIIDADVNKCNSDFPQSPTLASKEQVLLEFEHARLVEPIQIDIKQRDQIAESTANNNPTTIAHDNIQISSEKCDIYDKNIPIVGNIKSVPEASEKQKLTAVQLWKDYIKELPLELGKINNEETYKKYCEFDNQKDIAQQNFNRNMLPPDFPETANHNPEVKEKEDLNRYAIEPMKKTKGGFIPPYKDFKTANSENLPLQQNTNNNNDMALMGARKDETLEIELPENNKEIRKIVSYNASSAFGNQLASLQQSLSFATCLHKSQPNYNKHTLYVSSNAIRRSTELNKTELPDISLQKNNDHEIKCITPCNNLFTDTFENHPIFTQQSYSDKSSFNMPESHENKILFDIESSNECNKEIIAHNSDKSRAVRNQPFAQQDKNHDASSTNSQKHYINKYSFSSNKIDVSTKETADHVVRVIRKLRIDLDVTEFVSEEDKNVGNNNKGPDIQEQVIDDSWDNSVFTHPNTTSITNIMQCNEKYSIPANHTSKLKSTDAKGHMQTQSTIIKPTIQLIDTEIKEVDMKNDNNLLEELKAQKDNDIEMYKKTYDTFSEYKIEDTPDEKKTNNVESILLKYSNIMRNRNTKNADLTLSQIKGNEIGPQSTKKDKPKRPFKISDIQRLMPTPLPGTMIEKPKAVNVTECFNLLQQNDQHKLEQNKQLICNLTIPTSKVPMIEQEYDDTLEAVVQNTSNIEKLDDLTYMEDLEVKDIVSNIDQTMFNPKTLLQCFSKDESDDFIPPPPEFSDNFNTSFNTNADITLPTDCYEPLEWEVDSDVSHDTSIFQEVEAELTPSKEIETWNLSKDDSFNLNGSPNSSPYSFTIMRKNKEAAINKSLLQNPSLPRHIKLKQFKFNHKNKFNF